MPTEEFAKESDDGDMVKENKERHATLEEVFEEFTDLARYIRYDHFSNYINQAFSIYGRNFLRIIGDMPDWNYGRGMEYWMQESFEIDIMGTVNGIEAAMMSVLAG